MTKHVILYVVDFSSSYVNHRFLSLNLNCPLVSQNNANEITFGESEECAAFKVKGCSCRYMRSV